MEHVLYILAEVTRTIAIMLQPFTPHSAKKILLQLGYSEDDFNNDIGGISFKELTEEYALVPGKLLPKPEGVFPRIMRIEHN